MIEQLLDPKTLASKLGIRLGTLYTWSHKRKIPSVKVGAKLKFRTSDVEKWLKKQERSVTHR